MHNEDLNYNYEKDFGKKFYGKKFYGKKFYVEEAELPFHPEIWFSSWYKRVMEEV